MLVCQHVRVGMIHQAVRGYLSLQTTALQTMSIVEQTRVTVIIEIMESLGILKISMMVPVKVSHLRSNRTISQNHGVQPSIDGRPIQDGYAYI